MKLMNEVMDCIVENKLPIVVHNGFLDMMHVIYSLIIDILEIFCKTTPHLAALLSETS